MARKEVPVLCYHQIRAGKATNLYTVSPDQFGAQMKTLADSGYHTILPRQLYAYLHYGTPLPARPVMITFDDSRAEQYKVAKPEMDKYGFKAVYFIMTIAIGRPNYLSADQIKQLDSEGHTIAAHTWDHSRFDRYVLRHEKEIGGKQQVVNDYDLQLGGPQKKLAAITGKTPAYFAYPFGIWHRAGIPELKQRGYQMAFQLAARRDSTQPLYTIRRILVTPQYTPQRLLQAMNSSFH